MPDPSKPLISVGTAAFRRACLALFSGGFATFAAMYCVQPLLPVFTREFGLNPAASSISLSVSTGVLAVAMLGSSFVSDLIGSKATMVGALILSSLFTVALSVTSDWNQILVLRGLAGLALSGFPAISIAYLADEMDRTALGIAVGLTIAGNSIGGMSGRLIVSVVADYASWRMALAVLGGLCLLCSLILWAGLPASRKTVATDLSAGGLAASFVRHLRDPGLLMLFAVAFCLMGGFVTLYNYVGFRLLQPPFSLSQTLVGFVFLLYAAGTASSSIAGWVANRTGRRTALLLTISLMLFGVALTIPDSLWLIVVGIGLFTVGFFAAHAVASSWVGLRADGAKAQASSLYMLTYYMGSSIAGSLGGVFWSHAGWPGVAGLIGCLGLIALALSIALSRTPPPAWLQT
ncbi:MAG: MFS transporter [Ancalomicrobiaceae bacterium]|nr:MFS transporter [Ancalomicrobiaceae bacterium]